MTDKSKHTGGTYASTTMLVIVGIFLFLIPSIIFTVTEGNRALINRLGGIVQDSQGQSVVKAPGLHWRIPFIDSILSFDVKLQSFEEQSSRILTQEQKYVLVDYYVKWKIDNLSLYFKRTQNSSQITKRLLKQKVNDNLRAAFGKRTVKEVVSGERMEVINILRENVNTSAEELGVKIIDVRVKRIDLPKEVSISVFSRMRAERQQVASKHRADGHAAAEKIKAGADANVVITLAQARSEGAQIKSEGIEKAAVIYNKAYTKDESFYRFYRSMEAYKQSFKSAHDVLVLKPDSDYFKYFQKSSAS
jgi:modulator of FtsH protease HflC